MRRTVVVAARRLLPYCGPDSVATPDPVIWSVDRLHGTDVFISGQLRNSERLDSILASGVDVFVDIAGPRKYVWRPDVAALRERGVTYTLVEGVEDTGIDLPDFAFDDAYASLNDARAAGRSALIFCAGGLKRSPHVLYGVLRAWGQGREDAWAAIVAARPFIDPWQPYLDAAERWLAKHRAATVFSGSR